MVSLKLGFVNNDGFSNKEIADIVGIKEDEVIVILKEYLELYRKRLLALYERM